MSASELCPLITVKKKHDLERSVFVLLVLCQVCHARTRRLEVGDTEDLAIATQNGVEVGIVGDDVLLYSSRAF